jgi:hypothetical protein
VAASEICAQAQYTHSGKVVDAPTDKVLSDVTATAYGSNERKDNGLCPKYGVYLGDSVTSKAGAFTLRIPQANASYLVTYCNPRYAAFTHDGNDNSQDRAPIDPMPIRLFPRDPLAADMLNAIGLLNDDGRSVAIRSRNADANGFAEMLDRLPEPEMRLVRSWVNNPVRGVLRTTDTLSLDRLTRGVRIALEYFRVTDSKAFDSAVPQFPEISLYAIERHILPLPVKSALSSQASSQVSYQVGFTFPHNDDDVVNGRKITITGSVVTGGLEPKPVTAEELQSRGHIVVVVIHDPKAAHVYVGPIATDAKGQFSEEVDLGEPVRGEVRELELTVIVATPHVFERELKNLMGIRDSLCIQMFVARIHQSTASE